MDPITITTGNQTTKFTKTSVAVNGTEYLYSSITSLVRVPQRQAYVLMFGGQMVSIPYDTKDAPLLQALLERIAEARHLKVEEYKLQEPVSMAAHGGDPKAGKTAGDAGGKDAPAGILGDRRFVIGLGIGIALILFVIAGFLLH